MNASETQLGVFYAKDRLDITQDVIVTLNASSKTKVVNIPGPFLESMIDDS